MPRCHLGPLSMAVASAVIGVVISKLSWSYFAAKFGLGMVATLTPNVGKEARRSLCLDLKTDDG